MTRPDHALLLEQVIDKLDQWNFKYIADAALYNGDHGHVANAQLRTVAAVAHTLGFTPTLVPRKRADRRRHLHGSPSLMCGRVHQCRKSTERPTSR